MRQELVQGGDRLGLGWKYRTAFCRELIGDAFLCRCDHKRLSRLPAERGRVPGKRLDIIAGTCDGNAD
jgi:hypothetical protein